MKRLYAGTQCMVIVRKMLSKSTHNYEGMQQCKGTLDAHDAVVPLEFALAVDEKQTTTKTNQTTKTKQKTNCAVHFLRRYSRTCTTLANTHQPPAKVRRLQT